MSSDDSAREKWDEENSNEVLRNCFRGFASIYKIKYKRNIWYKKCKRRIYEFFKLTAKKFRFPKYTNFFLVAFFIYL